MSDDAGTGGRVFFSSVRRSLEEEDEIRLLSVGVDIGSSTSHLVFSRLVLERLDSRYVVTERKLIHESEVVLTPYMRTGQGSRICSTGGALRNPDAAAAGAAEPLIDAAALGAFIERQYVRADIKPASIDTGALILTGVALQRNNARAIADLFALQAGKLVAVSAGDALEATLAAFGSGAAARSIRAGERVMNVDIGGGTCKIAVCEDGEVTDMTALDIGARLISFDQEARLLGVERAALPFAAEASLALRVGAKPDPAGLDRFADCMADRLFEAMRSRAPSESTVALLRLAPLRNERPPDVLSFSGGVSEYIYGCETRDYGDLGPRLAAAILARVRKWGPRVEPPAAGIRATVIGASQYTAQLSGSTIFVTPDSVLPLRNVPVVPLAPPLADETLDRERIARALRASLRRLDLHAGDRPVALSYRWQGSASFRRLDEFCRGVAAGLGPIIDNGLPVILVGDGDVGGLVGIHCSRELGLSNPIVSIDGILLKEFDFIDIGMLLETSGAVPVVIKSLVFPGPDAAGHPVSS